MVLYIEVLKEYKVMFKLKAPYKPTGDQPEAIRKLVVAIKNNIKYQVLLGATGTGKTFTMANVIAQVQKPTLILVHNKTLAMQLYGELKTFFLKIALNILSHILIFINLRHIYQKPILILIKILNKIKKLKC